MKSFRTIPAILLIATLLFSGVYATGNKTPNTDLQKKEINTYEVSYDGTNEGNLEFLDDDFSMVEEYPLTFENELELLIELELEDVQIKSLEILFNKAIKAETSDNYDLANQLWDTYYEDLESYYNFSEFEFMECDFNDEFDSADYTFEDELEFLQELELDNEKIASLKVMFNNALNADSNQVADGLWALYYETLGNHFEFGDDTGETKYSTENELEFLNSLGLEENTVKLLINLYKEAIIASDADNETIADQKWSAYDELLNEHYDFESTYTFEELLKEIKEDGIQLSAIEKTELESLYLNAVEKDDWVSFDEKLYEITGWQDEEQISISAVYNVESDKLVLSIDPNDYPTGDSPKELSKKLKVLHQKMWSRANALIPNEYLKYFNKLEIGTDGKDGIMASVVELEDLSKWAMFLDTKDSVTKNDFTNDFDFTVIHEFGHILTLNNTQLSQNKQVNTYSTTEGHSLSSSYINHFYQKFWKNTKINSISKDKSSDTDLNQYISDYAATNIEEDIAESFATFITDNKSKGTTIADKKVNFFYSYPELIKIRDEIRKELK